MYTVTVNLLLGGTQTLPHHRVVIWKEVKAYQLVTNSMVSQLQEATFTLVLHAEISLLN